MSVPALSSPKYHVLLDIDQVLCDHVLGEARQAAFFKDNGAIVDAVYPHYVFPGVKEFIRLLMRTEEIGVSFFSSAGVIRNRPFVDRLLKESLSPDEYEKAKNIKIFSKDKTVMPTDEQVRESCDWLECSPKVSSELPRKDLSVVCDGLLDNVVLIDDCPIYILLEQRRNYLCVEPTRVADFSALGNSKGDGLVHQANRIYFVAGMLFSAIRRAKDGNTPLASALFGIQYKLRYWDVAKDKGNYRIITDNFDDDRYYNLGLAELREVNPDLQFTTPESYQKSMSRELSPEEEREFLDFIRKREEVYRAMGLEEEPLQNRG